MIAFKADLFSGKSLRKDNAFVFSNVILNIGGAYNSNNGVFVAPVTGVYLFTAQLCLQEEVWAQYGIVVNDKAVSKTAVGESQWWKCYTFDAVTEVQKGSHVYLKCTRDCDDGFMLMTHEYATSSFSGALLHKTV